MQPIESTKEKCQQSEYELCRDGQFLRQSCPYGEQFAQGRCQILTECLPKNTVTGTSNGGGVGGIGGTMVDSQKCQVSQASLLRIFNKFQRNHPGPKAFVRTVKIVPNFTNVPRANGYQRIVQKAQFSIQHWEFAIGQQMCPDVK